ncbi:hypothetical protein [Streptomyces hokutonensis]|uniref:Uncharacterized protein n=1 Tax=Streptomyces hokutonensis TaxID=1306990 RepID=A0ABW6LZJ6_9ACTN
MQFVFFMTLPGLVVLLTLLAFLDQLLLKQTELKERQSALVMRDTP